MYEQLRQSVIELHDIARLVEQCIGEGQLSLDLRDCADRLHWIATAEFQEENK